VNRNMQTHRHRRRTVKSRDAADWERLAVASNPRFRAIMARSARRYRNEGGISPAEVRRRLGIAPKGRQRF
jgi:hypothetical protein